MKSLAVTASFVLLVMTQLDTAWAQRSAPCEAPELSLDETYNALVCSGLARLEAKRYADAVSDFESALAAPLFEVPNFQLFARLAIAYWKVGTPEASTKARANLEKARIAMHVLTRSYRCGQTPSGVILMDQSGTPLEGEAAEEIRKRMCGGIYDAYYFVITLQSFVADAKLVEVYLAARKLIPE